MIEQWAIEFIGPNFAPFVLGTVIVVPLCIGYVFFLKKIFE